MQGRRPCRKGFRGARSTPDAGARDLTVAVVQVLENARVHRRPPACTPHETGGAGVSVSDGMWRQGEFFPSAVADDAPLLEPAEFEIAPDFGEVGSAVFAGPEEAAFGHHLFDRGAVVGVVAGKVKDPLRLEHPVQSRGEVAREQPVPPVAPLGPRIGAQEVDAVERSIGPYTAGSR